MKKLREIAAINVASGRRIVEKRNTGLRPIAIEIGTQIKAPTPQKMVGAVDSVSIRNGDNS
jgi:hypothetical protein